jgi:hypothetical protein
MTNGGRWIPVEVTTLEKGKTFWILSKGQRDHQWKYGNMFYEDTWDGPEGHMNGSPSNYGCIAQRGLPGLSQAGIQCKATHGVDYIYSPPDIIECLLHTCSQMQ